MKGLSRYRDFNVSTNLMESSATYVLFRNIPHWKFEYTQPLKFPLVEQTDKSLSKQCMDF